MEGGRLLRLRDRRNLLNLHSFYHPFDIKQVHFRHLCRYTCDFSAVVHHEAARPDNTPVTLTRGEQLFRFPMENGIGVSRRTPEMFELEKLAENQGPYCHSDAGTEI